jgi:hypothetical protein
MTKKDWSKVNWDKRWFDRLKAEPARAREDLKKVVPHLVEQVPVLSTSLEELAVLIDALTWEDYQEWRKSKEGNKKHSYIREWQRLSTKIREATLPRISIGDCIHGHVYLLQSRNLVIGAWDSEKEGFAGIREKFGNRFIFVEYHWDCPSFATARPLEDLGPLPEGIEPVDHFGALGKDSGRAVYWDAEAKDDQNPLGRNRYKDTNEICEERSHHPHNDALFAYLEPYDKVELAKRKAEWAEVREQRDKENENE